MDNFEKIKEYEAHKAEVPSYELWKAVHEQWKVLLEENAQLKKWCEEFNALEVAKENTKLKSKLQLKETAYDFDTARLEEENTKLKELLKEVLRHDLSLKEVTELTRKIAQVLGEE